MSLAVGLPPRALAVATARSRISRAERVNGHAGRERGVDAAGQPEQDLLEGAGLADVVPGAAHQRRVYLGRPLRRSHRGTGALVKVNRSGTFTVVTGGLDRPTSLEFIGNTAYVVTLTGEIWTIDLDGSGHDDVDERWDD